MVEVTIINIIDFCPGGNEYYAHGGSGGGSLIITLIWTVSLVLMVGAIYGYLRGVKSFWSMLLLVVVVAIVTALNIASFFISTG